MVLWLFKFYFLLKKKSVLYYSSKHCSTKSMVNYVLPAVRLVVC